MARRMQLETGDVTLSQPRTRCFSIAFEDARTEVELTFDNVTAHVAVAEWSALIQQVRTRSLRTWKFSRMDPPMGEADFQRLLAEISNTPAYQLFLAGFDIAQVVGLVSDLDDQVVLSRCISLARRVPSVVGPKGLFFISDTLFSNADPAAIDQLVQSNKLCSLRADIANFNPVTKYYIPYATPIELVTNATSETRQLWERIRDYYYAFR